MHLNPGSPPAKAPKPIAFSLPTHDGWKRHAADVLKDHQQTFERLKINPDLEPPEPPSFVERPVDEDVQCFLMATLVHCMHPNAPREPCMDQGRDEDFHKLFVVPDPPTMPGRTPGMEAAGERGKAASNVPDVLIHPSDEDDPRQRYNWKGEKDDEGKYVKKSGDVITLKSQVRANCGKTHPMASNRFQDRADPPGRELAHRDSWLGAQSHGELGVHDQRLAQGRERLRIGGTGLPQLQNQEGRWSRQCRGRSSSRAVEQPERGRRLPA